MISYIRFRFRFCFHLRFPCPIQHIQPYLLCRLFQHIIVTRSPAIEGKHCVVLAEGLAILQRDGQFPEGYQFKTQSLVENPRYTHLLFVSGSNRVQKAAVSRTTVRISGGPATNLLPRCIR